MPPPRPQVFHITHLDNLARIVEDGRLLSDALILGRGGPVTTIGVSGIKQRRVAVIEVDRHPGMKVGDFVPFYFCPRSIMLFVIYRANHPELTYKGGQQPIVHLEADLREVVAWAEANTKAWAFSLSNAGAYYAEFRASLDDLGEINWEAVGARDFRDPDIKEGKQAEFLVEGELPWTLIRRVGVISEEARDKVEAILKPAPHHPDVVVRRDWYY